MLAIGRYSTAGTDARATGNSSHLHRPQTYPTPPFKASIPTGSDQRWRSQRRMPTWPEYPEGPSRRYGERLIGPTQGGLSCFHACRGETWRKISPTLPHAEKGNGTIFDAFWPGG